MSARFHAECLPAVGSCERLGGEDGATSTGPDSRELQHHQRIVSIDSKLHINYADFSPISLSESPLLEDEEADDDREDGDDEDDEDDEDDGERTNSPLGV